MSRIFFNRRTVCVISICVFGIVIVYYQWILPASHPAEDATLHALNMLNAVESNTSWILTFSNSSFISSWRVGIEEILLHNESSFSVQHNNNSKIDLGKISPIMNYTHDGLLSQNASVWTDFAKNSYISQQSVQNQWTVRKRLKAHVFSLEDDNDHELSAQQTMRDINRKSLESGLVNVVAMSLYGSEARYTAGIIRNAYLMRQNFPGWQLWVYIESPLSSKYPAVPEAVISRLVSAGAEVHYISPEDDMIPPMMWRFLVADDAAVDWFIVRDADSRLTPRDAAAVMAWLQSGRVFHCIRDHPSHAAFAVSGGLWGGRAPLLRQLLRRSWANLMHGVGTAYQDDMNFLNSIIWQRVEHHAYCVDSVSCDRWPNSFPFPVVRHGYEHVGQVYDEHERPRNDDVQILKHTLENRNCIPLS